MALEAELATAPTIITSRPDLASISSKLQAITVAVEVSFTASDFQLLAVKPQAASFILQTAAIAAAVAAVTIQIASAAVELRAVVSVLQVVVVAARVASIVAVTPQGSTASLDPPSWAVTSSAATSWAAS